MFNELKKTFDWQVNDGVRVSHINDVETLAVMGANLFIMMAFAVSFLALGFSLIQFITSTGDKKMIEKAQKNMLWSGMGLFACFALFGVKNVIFKLFGINL